MNSLPKISIVLTSYNQKLKLARAFESLINQTYKNLEIIIVDDCSTDGESIPYILGLAEQYPSVVRYHIQRRNVGIPRNKNTGLKMASGAYITYLDGDDYYYPHKLESEVRFLMQNSDVDVVYSNFEYRTDDNKLLYLWNEGENDMPVGDIFESVITRAFPKNTLYRFELMKSNVLKSIDYFDENIAAYHDWDSRIRYATLFKVAYNDSVCSAYLQDPLGISKRKSKAYLIGEMISVFEKNVGLLQLTPNSNSDKVIRSMRSKLYRKRFNAIEKTPELSLEAMKYILKYPYDFMFVGALVKNKVKALLAK